MDYPPHSQNAFEAILSRFKAPRGLSLYMTAYGLALVFLVILAVLPEPVASLGISGLIFVSAASVTAMISFLFALPRLVDTNKGVESTSEITRMRTTSTLERVSDWVVAMLIGIGLSQIGHINDYLVDFRAFLKSVAPHSLILKGVGPLLMMCGGALGLMLGYLTARLVDNWVLSKLEATTVEVKGEPTLTRTQSPAKTFATPSAKTPLPQAILQSDPQGGISSVLKTLAPVLEPDPVVACQLKPVPAQEPVQEVEPDYGFTPAASPQTSTYNAPAAYAPQTHPQVPVAEPQSQAEAEPAYPVPEMTRPIAPVAQPNLHMFSLNVPMAGSGPMGATDISTEAPARPEAQFSPKPEPQSPSRFTAQIEEASSPAFHETVARVNAQAATQPVLTKSLSYPGTRGERPLTPPAIVTPSGIRLPPPTPVDDATIKASVERMQTHLRVGKYNDVISLATALVGSAAEDFPLYWLHLGAAYGQKLTFLKKYKPDNLEEFTLTQQRSLDCIRNALVLDENLCDRIWDMADPKGMSRDFQELRADEIFRNLVGKRKVRN